MSCFHHQRFIGLPLNPVECGPFLRIGLLWRALLPDHGSKRKPTSVWSPRRRQGTQGAYPSRVWPCTNARLGNSRGLQRAIKSSSVHQPVADSRAMAMCFCNSRAHAAGLCTSVERGGAGYADAGIRSAAAVISQLLPLACRGGRSRQRVLYTTASLV